MLNALLKWFLGLLHRIVVIAVKRFRRPVAVATPWAALPATLPISPQQNSLVPRQLAASNDLILRISSRDMNSLVRVLWNEWMLKMALSKLQICAGSFHDERRVLLSKERGGEQLVFRRQFFVHESRLKTERALRHTVLWVFSTSILFVSLKVTLFQDVQFIPGHCALLRSRLLLESLQVIAETELNIEKLEVMNSFLAKRYVTGVRCCVHKFGHNQWLDIAGSQTPSDLVNFIRFPPTLHAKHSETWYTQNKIT